MFHIESLQKINFNADFKQTVILNLIKLDNTLYLIERDISLRRVKIPKNAVWMSLMNEDYMN